jgi:hypothetical protein
LQPCGFPPIWEFFFASTIPHATDGLGPFLTMAFRLDSEDEELQLALALSLQEQQAAKLGSSLPQPGHDAGPSEETTATAQPSAPKEAAHHSQQVALARHPTPLRQGNNQSSPQAHAEEKKTANKRKGKKLPSFNPSDSEVEGCFRELIGGGARGCIGVKELASVASKLGMGVDDRQAAAMLEWAIERGPGVADGRLGMEEFKLLVDHFRIG